MIHMCFYTPYLSWKTTVTLLLIYIELQNVLTTLNTVFAPAALSV